MIWRTMHYVTPILKIYATIKRDDPQDYPSFIVSGFDPKHLNMSPIGDIFKCYSLLHISDLLIFFL